MKRILAAVAVLMVIAAAGTAAAVTVTPAPHGTQALQRCPTRVIAANASLDDALTVARRLLIAGKTVTSQGQTVRLTHRNTPILAVARIFPAGHRPAMPGAEALRRTAERRCGAATARQSWAIVINYTYGSVASTNVWTWYIVQTRDGWKYY